MIRKPYYLLILAVVMLLAGCSGDNPGLSALHKNAVVLAFGDSLTFGTGANSSQSYPKRLADLTGLQVINAGSPGELTHEGAQRLPELLRQHKPELVILIHGGNDLLRKIDKQQINQNLQTMIDAITSSGAQMIMMAVPRPGLLLNPADLYREIAEENRIPIELDTLSELLQSSATKSDAIHPNAEGYLIMAQSLHRLMQQNGAL